MNPYPARAARRVADDLSAALRPECERVVVVGALRGGQQAAVPGVTTMTLPHRVAESDIVEPPRSAGGGSTPASGREKWCRCETYDAKRWRAIYVRETYGAYGRGQRRKQRWVTVGTVCLACEGVEIGRQINLPGVG